MLTLEFAGVNSTVPSVISSSDDSVDIFPSPEITMKMEGPGEGGTMIEVSRGRMHLSTSNSSKGGIYFMV